MADQGQQSSQQGSQPATPQGPETNTAQTTNAPAEIPPGREQLVYKSFPGREEAERSRQFTEKPPAPAKPPTPKEQK